MESANVLIWPGRAIYAGPLLGNDTHAHHAIQISCALGDPLSLLAPPDPRWRTFEAVATAPDQPHRIRCSGPIAQIYLDPHSAAGLTVRQALAPAPVRTVDVAHVEHLAAALRPNVDGWPDVERVTRVIDAIVGATTPDYSRDLVDPRIQRTLTTVHALPGHHVSVPALVEQVSLSPSRLGALFRRDIGIPLRRYLLWLRLIDAIEALSCGGTNLTDAAHRAGFADSAHFTRTFRRMFGMPPSALRLAHVEILDLCAGSAARPWWATTPTTTIAGRGESIMIGTRT